YAAHAYGHDVLRDKPPKDSDAPNEPALNAWGLHEGRAYLGYVNLGLGMLRLFDPTHPLSRVHDALTEELARRLDASPRGLIETYPGETWPPDVAAVAGSIGLHGRATGIDRAPLLARWAQRFERCAIAASGFLVQRVASGSCTPADAARGS